MRVHHTHKANQIKNYASVGMCADLRGNSEPRVRRAMSYPPSPASGAGAGAKDRIDSVDNSRESRASTAPCVCVFLCASLEKNFSLRSFAPYACVAP
jgi:hypothetical protein